MAFNRFDQLIDAWEPRLRQAFLQAVYLLRDAAQIAAIVRMLERNDIDGALRAVDLDPTQFRVFDKSIADAFEAGGNATATSIPPIRHASGLDVVVRFNARSPIAEAWLSTHSAAAVTAVLDDQRTMIRQHLTAGMEKGANPRAAALDLVGRINKTTGRREGGVIGLTASQAEAVRNFEADLASNNPAAALSRALRDPRFDAAVRRAQDAKQPVPADLRAKMVLAYRNRSLRQRGEAIARSETITALHTAQQQAMDQAVASGAIKQSALSYTWRSAEDDRVREAHRLLDGKVARAGEAFQSILGPIRYPGDPEASAANRINCRCWREPRVDFLAGVK